MAEQPEHEHDEAWLDVLARGKDSPHAGAHPDALRLKAALIEREHRAAERLDTTHDWERLRFQLRKHEQSAGRRGKPQLLVWAIAASLVLGIALISFRPGQEAAPDFDQMRGAQSYNLSRASPAEDALRLRRVLEEAGVAVTQSIDGRRIVLEFTLPAQPSDAIYAELAQLELSLIPGKPARIILQPFSN